jgi:hypothetical protein
MHEQCWATIRPIASWLGLVSSAVRVRPRGGLRARGTLSGATGESLPTALARRGPHPEHRRRAAWRSSKVLGMGMHRGDGSSTRWRCSAVVDGQRRTPVAGA